MTDTGSGTPEKSGIDYKKQGRRAWRAWGWFDRSRFLGSLFRTPGEVGLALGSAGVIATTAGLTASDAMISARNAAAPVVIEEKVRETKNSTVFEIIGFDKSGNRGRFDVVVLKKEFLWVKGSHDTLEKEGKTYQGSSIATELLDEEVLASLQTAREIVSVGTASMEGQAEEEKARAGRRAEQSANIVTGAVKDGMPVWALNLGQYRDQCADCETGGTSWQRPFIVIAVKDLDPGTNLGEALADAMTGKSKLPAPAAYSAFELKKIR